MLIRAFLFAECCAFRKTAYNSQIGSTSGASCCLRGRVRMPHPLQVDGNFRTPRGSRFTLLAHSKLRGSHAVQFLRWRSLLTSGSQFARLAVHTPRAFQVAQNSHGSHAQSLQVAPFARRTVLTLAFTADARFAYTLHSGCLFYANVVY